jgi:hypothetical protein
MKTAKSFRNIARLDVSLGPGIANGLVVFPS